MTSKQKQHRAEVALRTAAYAFVNQGPVKNSRDTDGQRANRRLLQAAKRYVASKEK
jgi:hypothetical protein